MCIISITVSQRVHPLAINGIVMHTGPNQVVAPSDLTTEVSSDGHARCETLRRIVCIISDTVSQRVHPLTINDIVAHRPQ